MEEINYLLQFRENWNGEGSKPLDPRVHKNLLKLIELDPNVFDDVELSLNNNGSVYIEKGELLMNIGSDQFSCIPDGIKENFNENKIIKIINKYGTK